MFSNTPCKLTGTRSIRESLTNLDVTKHEGLQQLKNMAEDVLETAAARPHSTFSINRLPREIIAEIFWNCLEH